MNDVVRSVIQPNADFEKNIFLDIILEKAVIHIINLRPSLIERRFFRIGMIKIIFIRKRTNFCGIIY